MHIVCTQIALLFQLKKYHVSRSNIISTSLCTKSNCELKERRMKKKCIFENQQMERGIVGQIEM